MKKEEPAVIVEQSFDKPVEEVWKAITELNQMVKWFFENIPEFKAEIGFKTEFNVFSGERDFLHIWEIVEVEELKKIVYNWQYSDYNGEGLVTFELSKLDNEKTKLKLTNEVLQDFPEEIPEFKRESCVGGWEYFINGRLKEYLDSK